VPFRRQPTTGLAPGLRWGVLDLDTTIAAVVRGLGWLGMVATWAWLVWRWSADDARPRTA